MSQQTAEGRLRLDKWLWTARFFKTRALANEAIVGGKVHLDGQRTKPGREVKLGARLIIRKDTLEWDVVVRGTARQRRPASEARLLYEETEQSIRKREEMAARMQQEAQARTHRDGRPTKRDRRRLDRVTSRDRP
jgi:ribosome-associated heat shock protein Hsp15